MTKLRIAGSITLLLSLAACDGLVKSDPDTAPAQQKRAPATDEAQIEANIVIGRVEVMQEQTYAGLVALDAPALPIVEQPTDRDTYRRLNDAVGRYNDLRTTACKAGVVAGNLCGPEPFLPLWYAGRARPDTSPRGLKAMAEDMQNQMIPLWQAVCAKAIARIGDENFCAIE